MQRRLRAADEFDGSIAGLGAEARAIAAALSTSMFDDKGAVEVNVNGPEPTDEVSGVTVHLGHIPLFAEGGPSAADVEQGKLGTCSLLSVAAGVAATDPARVRQMITDNGDGTYTVFIEGEHVTVDDEFIIHQGPEDTEPGLWYAGRLDDLTALWPLVLEKAAAMLHGEEYENIMDDEQPAVWLEALGYEHENIDLDPDDVDELEPRVREALDSGLPVTADASEAFGMGARHAWTVMELETVDGETFVVLRNPWGEPGFQRVDGGWERQVGRFTWEAVEFEDESDAGRITVDPETGLMRMPIDVFATNFDHVDVATGPAS